MSDQTRRLEAHGYVLLDPAPRTGPNGVFISEGLHNAVHRAVFKHSHFYLEVVRSGLSTRTFADHREVVHKPKPTYSPPKLDPWGRPSHVAYPPPGASGAVEDWAQCWVPLYVAAAATFCKVCWRFTSADMGLSVADAAVNYMRAYAEERKTFETIYLLSRDQLPYTPDTRELSGQPAIVSELAAMLNRMART